MSKAVLLPRAALSVIVTSSLFVAINAFSLDARSAVTADEAQKLHTTLTPFGAERAGNKDGSIPAWTGVMVKGAEAVDGKRPDPFANEKPLYSVTKENVDRYAEKLSDGQIELFRKYPEYRIDVYPTHRTGMAPQWVYDATFKNATSAKLEAGNMRVVGAYGGIPFPIPKSGDEVLWNHLLRYGPVADISDSNQWAVTSDGKPVLLESGKLYVQRPYYVKDGNDKFDGYYWKGYIVNSAPAVKAGEAILEWNAIDRADRVDPAWTYLPGQRRVRKLPVAAYDTPVPTTSGFSTFDELNLFLGAPDRYDWKLIGKKEMIVPYNENKTLQVHDDAQLLGKHFINPDHVRWELHRVWVVDATLRSGKRHEIPHKRFYFDEDTWTAVLEDGWDANGQLVKTYWQWLAVVPEAEGVLPIAFGDYDLLRGGYLTENITGSKREQFVIPSKGLPDNMFTADAMAAAGQ
ncbi:MAG TPA: DUF1329 domain-containing protein [Paraburkholderia sp.]|uniref:DUF1329 domain-containing protein n=1 Tax=Paraburkholderia sp. TaxID=1926495 RepID=UPI002B4696C9|nr:DUF1329 domain-containing protein [Paraburkholderia sp.]HKR46928.1 DUF1329 domain-containing protein [Paraburkholderia sp.]